jgi:hypothetical protein
MVSTQLPEQLSMVPRHEELPPMAVEPPVVLGLLPEPPVVLGLLPEPPLPLEALSEPPTPFPVFPVPVEPVSELENEPHAEKTTAPSDTTTDTGTRVRIFFMATSPIVKPTYVGLGKVGEGTRARCLPAVALTLRGDSRAPWV